MSKRDHRIHEGRAALQWLNKAAQACQIDIEGMISFLQESRAKANEQAMARGDLNFPPASIAMLKAETRITALMASVRNLHTETGEIIDLISSQDIPALDKPAIALDPERKAEQQVAPEDETLVMPPLVLPRSKLVFEEAARVSAPDLDENDDAHLLEGAAAIATVNVPAEAAVNTGDAIDSFDPPLAVGEVPDLGQRQRARRARLIHRGRKALAEIADDTTAAEAVDDGVPVIGEEDREIFESLESLVHS